MKYIIAILLLISTLLVTSCGGGGGGTGGGGDTPTTPTTYSKAVITLATSNKVATLSAPVQIIKISLKLPANAAIANLQQDVSGSQIDKGSLNLDPTNMILTIQVSGKSINSGIVAAINASIPATTSPSEADFSSINNPYPSLAISGMSNGTTFDLTSEVDVKMSVTFQ